MTWTGPPYFSCSILISMTDFPLPPDSPDRPACLPVCPQGESDEICVRLSVLDALSTQIHLSIHTFNIHGIYHLSSSRNAQWTVRRRRRRRRRHCRLRELYVYTYIHPYIHPYIHAWVHSICDSSGLSIPYLFFPQKDICRCRCRCRYRNIKKKKAKRGHGFTWMRRIEEGNAAPTTTTTINANTTDTTVKWEGEE